MLWLSWFFGGGRGDAAEVSVFEAVRVAAQVDDLGVMDEAVEHGGCDDVVAEDFAPASEGFVAGTIREARSFLLARSWKNRFAASGSKGMYPTSSMTRRGYLPRRRSSS